MEKPIKNLADEPWDGRLVSLDLLAALLGPGEGHELRHPGGREASGDAAENIGEVGERVYPLRHSGADNGEDGCSTFGACVGASKQPVFAAGGQQFEAPLGFAVVDFETTVVEGDEQGRPLILCVGERFAQGRFRQDDTGDGAHPVFQALQYGQRLCLAQLQACLRRQLFVLGESFDLVDVVYERQGNSGTRVTGLVCIEEVATGVHHAAGSRGSGGRFFRIEKRCDATVAVALNDAVITFQKCTGVFAAPVGCVTVDVPHGIAAVSPDVAALDALGVVAVEHPQAGVVLIDDVTGQGLLCDVFGGAKQQVGAVVDDVAQGGGWNFDARAFVNARQAIQRQPIDVFADENVRHQAVARHTALDNFGRCWSDADLPLAGLTGKLFAFIADNPERCRDVVKSLTDLMADAALFAAADSANTLRLRHLDDIIHPWQVFGQLTAPMGFGAAFFGRLVVRLGVRPRVIVRRTCVRWSRCFRLRRVGCVIKQPLK